MRRLFKQIIACITVISIIATLGITAFAHKEMDNMVFAGYNTVDPYNPYKVYNEVINGKYTDKQVLVPVTPTWSAEGYEGVYPYAGYSRMYLDGKAQEITCYNNLFPQWETRRQDYMWELHGSHVIWERQQTKVNNKTWTWDFGNANFNIPDSVVKTRTARNAYVVDQGYNYYGFGNLTTEGKLISGEQEYMYKNFNLSTGTVYSAAVEGWRNALANELTVENLSATYPGTNRYVMTDADIAALIPVVHTKYVTAKFDENSDKGLMTKVVADEYLKHINDGWTWDVHDSFAVTYDANIYWTAPTYEMENPYLMYQYLVVNHVVLDGTNGKPEVLRYTDGKVLPEIEWKLEFYQKALDENGNVIPYLVEAVERKYVDGVPAVDTLGQPVYRIPLHGYTGNCYFKANDNTLEYWGVDDFNGETRILAIVENWTGTLQAEIDAYISSSLHLTTSVAAEQYNVLP